MTKPVLYIFSGLPGVGKSTLAKLLALKLRAAHIRIDSIEQELRDCGLKNVQTEGYRLAYRIAADTLSSGCDVVADSVNAIAITRKAWMAVASATKSDFKNIEIICSDKNEHRYRAENREAEVENLKLPTWEQITSRTFEDWHFPGVRIDTAGKTVEQSLQELLTACAK